MKYGLIGEKLSHSYSKIIHEKLGNSEYILTEVAKQDIDVFFKNREFDAINVTIPYKKNAFTACDKLSETALAITSVNTVIKRADGTLFGDNTDAYGFEYMLKSAGIDPDGKKCIILGSGGSSVTVNYVLNKLGASSVIVISRNGEDNYENISKHYDAQIIVNTTPVGMYPKNGESLIDLSEFTKCCGVADLIYNPMRTRLILDALELKIPCVSGLVMLVAQAKRAHELFFDTDSPADILEMTEEISRDMKNIVLIGMPGAGKTTVGRRLAEMTGREFIDTDQMIEQSCQKSIPDIFAELGESGFRKIETEILKKACQKSRAVIACGGGVVTVSENLGIIRQNSTVFRIDRPLDQLAVAGRPLSGEKGVIALFEQRDALYCQFADYTVFSVDADSCAERIIDIYTSKGEKK